MKLLNTFNYEIKKSKFIAYYYEVQTKEEVDELLISLKKEHKKARHIPYAYKIDNLIRKVMIRNLLIQQELLFIN